MYKRQPWSGDGDDDDDAFQQICGIIVRTPKNKMFSHLWMARSVGYKGKNSRKIGSSETKFLILIIRLIND